MALIGGTGVMRSEVLRSIEFQGKAVGKVGSWQAHAQVHTRCAREIPYSSLVPIGIGRRDKEVAAWAALGRELQLDKKSRPTGRPRFLQSDRTELRTLREPD